jgi:hypothetical protein
MTTPYAALPADVDPSLARRVRQGADNTVADGSEARPFATITAALEGAPPDAWVLVAAGTYSETITLARPAHVLGVCASRVRLESTDGGRPLIESVGHALDLRGVSLSSSHTAVSVQDADARLERVVVTRAVAAGVRVSGAGRVATLRDVVLRAGPDPSSRPMMALGAYDGVVVRGTAVHIDGPRYFGVYSAARARVSLTDSLVRNAVGVPPAASGGAFATGGSIALTRAVFEQNNGSQLESREGGSLALTDVVVRCAAACRANGAQVRSGATLTAERFEVDGAFGFAVITEGRAELRSWIARDVRGPANEGAALRVYGETARAIVEGARIDGALGGVELGAGAQAQVRTLLARRCTTGAFRAEATTSLDAQDSVIEDSALGVVASGEQTRITMRSSVIRRGSAPAGRRAIGVGVYDGASVTIERSRVRGVVGAATVVVGGELTVRDAVIESTRSAPGVAPEGVAMGPALSLSTGTATFERVTMDDNLTVAIAVRSGVVRATDLAVTRTLNTRSAGPATDYNIGAVFGSNDSELHLERAVISGSEGAGIAGYRARVVSLTDVLVRDTVTDLRGRYGAGVLLVATNEIALRRVWVDRARSYGVAFIDEEPSRRELEDVIVTRVLPDTEVQSAGVALLGGTTRMRRDAVQSVVALGFAAMPLTRDTNASPPVVDAADLWVSDVRPGRIRCTQGGAECIPEGPFTSYGIYLHDGELALERATIAGGGYGFYLHGGSLRWRSGLVRGQLDAAGSWRLSAPSLVDVVFVANARDEVLAGRELTAFSTFALPTPL